MFSPIINIAKIHWTHSLILILYSIHNEDGTDDINPVTFGIYTVYFPFVLLILFAQIVPQALVIKESVRRPTWFHLFTFFLGISGKSLYFQYNYNY